MTDFFDYWSTTLFSATFRVTICFTVAYLLLRSMQIHSPRLHRIAWAVVVCQGCMLGSWTIAVSVPFAQSNNPISSAEYVKSEVSLEDTNQVISTPRQTIYEPEVKWPIWDISRQMLVSLWVVGIVFAASRNVWRYATFVGTFSLGKKPKHDWLMEWEEALHEFPNVGSVQLRVTESIGPSVCFVPWGYLVLVPQSIWHKLTPQERLSVLRHELSHIQRRDLWKAVVIRVAALLQWFNPLVWNAVQRFDEASEWACDDQVRALSTSEYDYAKTLLTVGEYATHPPSFMPSISGGNLSKRIRRLVIEIKEDSIVKKCILTIALALVSLTAIRIQQVSADDGTHRENGVAEVPVSIKELRLAITKHSVELTPNSPLIVRFDVPVKAFRSRDVTVVKPVRKNDMCIELTALKLGSTDVEVQTPNNGTIVLEATARPQRYSVELKLKVFELDADIPTLKRTLERLFDSQVPKSDGRMFMTVGDERAFQDTLDMTQAKLIAEPTLTNLSGGRVGFNVGSEVPVLIPQGLGTVSVEYRQVGTRVDLVPVLVGQQRLRLEVRPSVTRLKTATSGDTAAPEFVSRHVEASTEMGLDKTLVVAMVDKDPEDEAKQQCLITMVRVSRVSAAEEPHPSTVVDTFVAEGPQQLTAPGAPRR